jgi:hypothetical protein
MAYDPLLMKPIRSTTSALVAASTVGALVLAGAGPALADPGHGKGKSDQHKSHSHVLTLRSVDIKNHRPINVFSATTVRPLTVRATVRDRKSAGTQKVAVTVTLDQYTAKHGTPTTSPALSWNADASGPIKAVALTTVVVKRNEARYRGTYLFPAQAVAPGQTATVCLATATVTALEGQKVLVGTNGKKAQKKLTGGDCVRIINVDPASLAAGDH